MFESIDLPLGSPSPRRRRVASVAYVMVALLVGIAIAREFVRVKQARTTVQLNVHPAGKTSV